MKHMIRKYHRWLGLALALPLIIEAISGILLIVLPLLLSGRPQYPVTSKPLSSEALITAARHAAPASMIPLRFDPARWDGDGAIVTFGPPTERHPTFQVMLNPENATINRIHEIPKFLRFLHNLHANLLLLPYGETATSMMGVGLLFFAISGVFLWWPRHDLWKSGKWRKTVLPSFRARGYRLWREIHISLGIWTTIMLVFMSISGTLLAFPFSRSLLGVPYPRVTLHQEPILLAPPHGEEEFDRTITLVQREYPQAIFRHAQLGSTQKQQRLQFSLPAYGPNTLATMHLDTKTGKIILVQDPADEKWGAWIFRWLHTLHEARLEGPLIWAPLWKFLVFCTGLALTYFSISGIVMSVLRTNRAVPTRGAVRSRQAKSSTGKHER
ncbi:PepSY-associated TM helix domain-containing protein [Gluconobacter sp. GP1]|uniref:PepSY-associated TM helix domain-containing protein n=1 Tax=Gluconobacter sp. GP1 TaxID=3046423 RepID=UPI00293EDB88|nr:PepSY-associated TM helix domain-containing protein [Gluconobacter sp. GP1]